MLRIHAAICGAQNTSTIRDAPGSTHDPGRRPDRSL
jgi:hypothetical protein